jgi:hypothetical protein
VGASHLNYECLWPYPTSPAGFLFATGGADLIAQPRVFAQLVLDVVSRNPAGPRERARVEELNRSGGRVALVIAGRAGMDLKARHLEPSFSPTAVDQLLGREAGSSTQICEVAFGRAWPDTDACHGSGHGTTGGHKGNERSPDPAAAGRKVVAGRGSDVDAQRRTLTITAGCRAV